MKRLVLILNKIFIIILITIGVVRPQAKTQLGFWEEHKRIWSSGFNKNKHTVPLWCTALTTFALIAKDEEIYHNIKKFQNKNPSLSRVSETITLLGDGYVDLSIIGFFYLRGRMFNDKRAAKTASLGFRGMMHTGFIVQVFNHLSGRQRPSADSGRDRWHGPAGAPKRYTPGRWDFYDSFPSGHTIAAWSLATVISHQYSHIKMIPPLAYTLATGAGLSRITEDTHWASDVFLGAIIGYEVTRQILQNELPSNYTIVPQRGGFLIHYYL